MHKDRFPLQSYHKEKYRISLFRERAGKTNDMVIWTAEFAMFCYDTVEVL